jgi:hypothetical protein
MRSIESRFPGVAITKKFRLRDYLSTTSGCKLYDFEAGKWLRYPLKRAA